MKLRFLYFAFIVLYIVAGLNAFAQETPTLQLTESDELGQYLVNSDGFTVYLFLPDGPQASTCSGDCLAAWPPVTVADVESLTVGEGIIGELGTIEREDSGELQVTYNRMPLYLFVNDTAAGEITGQGVGDVWFVVHPQVLSLGGNAELGQFLTDADGFTVYTFANDTADEIACTGACIERWIPVTVQTEAELYAGLDAVPQADLSLVERTDTGDLQVAYLGQPLYTFVSDEAPGDATGDGLNDVWDVVRVPRVVVAANDALGSLLVRNDGTTLYTFVNDAEGVSNCNGGCARNWPPLTVLTESDLDNVDEALRADLSLITREDGALQIAYQGLPLYAWVRDAAPGDTTGDGVGGNWSAALVAGGAAATEACTVTPSANVNLRQGPGTAYFLAGVFPTNESRDIVGQANGTDGFVWWNLADGSWVRSDLVTAAGECSGVPTVSAPPPPPTAAPVAPAEQPQQPAEQQQQPAQQPPAPSTTEEAP